MTFPEERDPVCGMVVRPITAKYRHPAQRSDCARMTCKFERGVER